MSSMTFEQLSDGSAQYTTVDGDMIDLIAFNFYGTHDGTSELLLESNPHIVDLGPVLQAGVKIKLPADPPDAKYISTVSLWD